MKKKKFKDKNQANTCEPDSKQTTGLIHNKTKKKLQLVTFNTV